MGTPRRVTAAAALLPLLLAAAACGTERPGDLGALPADVRGVDVPTEALSAVMGDPVMADPVVATPARAPAVRAAVAVPAPTRTELDDVPAAAMSAYHRAATIMGEAAPQCGLQWPLLAGIGRIETEHGDGRLDEDGLARPALIGAPLNGRHQRPRVRDTDAGELDQDPRWDRVVGPFRVLPSTWSVVAVDADGDGRRDPQDIDDAALGTAVQLCGTGQQLATRDGMTKALRKLRSQRGYAAAVLGWYDAYVEAERSMAVSIRVVTYGDWSGAVEAVAELAPPAPRAAEQARPKPTKPQTTSKPRPQKGQPKPKPQAPAEVVAPQPEVVEPVAQPPAPPPPPAPAPAPAPAPEPAPEPGGSGGGAPAPGDGTPTCEPTDAPTDPAAPPPPPPGTPTDESTDPVCTP